MDYASEVASTQEMTRPAGLARVRGWIGLALAAGIPAIIGLLVALTMPRGPASAPQALMVMALGLVAGSVASLSLRSRWALLLAPLAYGIVFELGRAGASGPLVDAPNLETSYGLLALVLGRGVHALLALLPTTLGVV